MGIGSPTSTTVWIDRFLKLLQSDISTCHPNTEKDYRDLARYAVILISFACYSCAVTFCLALFVTLLISSDPITALNAVRHSLSWTLVSAKGIVVTLLCYVNH